MSEPKSVTFYASFTRDEAKRIDEYAEELDVNSDVLIRHAVLTYITTHDRRTA